MARHVIHLHLLQWQCQELTPPAAPPQDRRHGQMARREHKCLGVQLHLGPMSLSDRKGLGVQ